MKIQSKFQDYYDSFQFDNGEDVYYNRNMNCRYLDTRGLIISSPDIIECDKIFQKYLPNRSDIKQQTSRNSEIKRSVLTFNIIFIGNKIVPYCSLYYGDYFDYITGKNVEYINIFSLDDINNQFELTNFRLKYIKEHLTKNHRDLFNKIREISKEPIISYSSYKNKNNISEYIIMRYGTMLNPSLKELGLSKIVESSQVIQELELFIKGNVTVEKEVQFSNELKIQNAGFDEKSFRNTK